MKQKRDPQTRPTDTVKWSLKKEQKQFYGERITFSTNSTEVTGIHMQKLNINKDLIPFRRINSGCITDLNVKCKKFIELLDIA